MAAQAEKRKYVLNVMYRLDPLHCWARQSVFLPIICSGRLSRKQEDAVENFGRML